MVLSKKEELTGVQPCGDSELAVACLDGTLSNVRLWNTWDKGTPFVYRVKVTLCAKDGTVLDAYEETTGFRKIEMQRTPEMTKVCLKRKRFLYERNGIFSGCVCIGNE